MIDHLIATDIGGRGVERLYLLYKAKRPDYFQRSLEIISSAKRILIVSDFPIPPSMIPETDGPPGAVALALALKDLGKRAIILTQELVKIGIEDFYQEVITEMPKTNEFDCLISVETPGRNYKGKYLSFSGLEIRVREYDRLFMEALEMGIPTIGIGDGGNEIGMGNLELRDERYSVVKASEVIIAGVSNWGAYGLVAGLSIENGVNLLKDYDEGEVLKSLVNAGLIDGITKKNEPSVDGLPSSIHERMLKLLNEIINVKIQ
ncbi:glutamate cyclase domain-containing protein [Pyrococcus sp. NA2]|uniref:glutamate cyclase domain-containing protein n=1 Tax=Pyrococcus sp. (strain NA2) TaxID=342949 RepID=UPI00064FC8B9|nr:glutamate cyclase domain-containing protein [Pyrococcus sp. NA2]